MTTAFKNRIKTAIAQIQDKPILTEDDYRRIYPAIANNPKAWRVIASSLLDMNFLTIHQTRTKFAEKVREGAIGSEEFLECVKKYL
ncbi:MAG: hypothetical protein KatS3mg087_0583 [Patescibacteria group bacterium]|nr:MAG: hypothetical protein KatS3mg087_0583 [Patescibacteria group bacterium]